MGTDSTRVVKELAECAKDSKSNIICKPVGDSITHLEGSIQGPEGTPFEGGTFLIDINIPPTYPFEPPKMKFITKIWHPNISSQTGAICLDILKDQWSPALTIKTALLSLQALMCSAEPDDPQNAEAADMYVSNREMYNQTAKLWAEKYAQPKKERSNEEAVQRVCDMGFAAEAARKALEANGWDERAAINSLLPG
ncbi:unnamed protein product [Chrysoparadoxa australica]